MGSLAHKRRVKKRDPEGSLGCIRFCDLIFKGCASFSEDQNPQTNKALKIRYVQSGTEFPGNILSWSGIDNHKPFDSFFAADGRSLYF